MKYVTRDGKEGDRAWMLAVGDSQRGPEDEGIQVRHKENMSLEYSRAKLQEQDYLSPLLGQKLQRPEGALRLWV